MATHHGKNGVVKVGTNSISQVTAFSITESADTVRTDAMGDGAKTFAAGKSEWSGSVTVRKDSGDTTGQGALAIGSEVSLKLYAEGETSGLEELIGTAIVTGRNGNVDHDSVNEESFDVQGTGALTRGTVSA